MTRAGQRSAQQKGARIARGDTHRHGERPDPPEPLPHPVVDNHCHLDIPANDGPGEPVPVADALARAAAVGVPRIVQIGCDLPGARWAVEVAAEHDDVVAGVALHPNDAASLDVRVDPSVLAYTGGVAILSTLLFGLAPAMHATRVDVSGALKGDAADGPRVRGTRLRAFFLVTQIASSVVLLVVASTFVRTLVGTYVGDQGARLDRLVLAQVSTADTSAA